LDDLADVTDRPGAAGVARRLDDPAIWHDDVVPGVVWMSGISTEYTVDPVDEYVIGTPTGRRGFHLVRGRGSLLVAKDDLLTLDPEHRHRGTRLDDGPWSARLIVLPAAFLMATLDEAPAVVRSPITRPVVRDADLRSRLLAVHRASEHGEGTRFARECALLALLDDLGPVGDPSQRPVADPAVIATVELLRDRFIDHLDLDTISAAVGESKFRLLRRFRAVTGMTPHQFLVSMRIAEARRLLAAGLAPAEVAAMTGFADQSHLTRRFRSRIGFTPGRYRESAGR
jgi:AraC-like DNA-binding protein